MTNFLDEDVIKQVRDVFDAQLKQPVEVLFFGRQDDCDYCEDTQQLIEEVTAISDKLRLSIYDLDKDAALARQYHVDKAPGLVLTGRDGDQLTDYGIRFSGLPSGYEFASLINDLILVSGRDSGLRPQTRNFLKNLKEPIHLQVFVTPTCPYCPSAVVLAHRMALESHWVEAEMVEAMEFPELSEQFGVSGVPQTTINAGAGLLFGAAPEERLLAEVMKAIKA